MSQSSTDQPFWSVMITSYNRGLVAQAIASVLAQDQGPERMQIQVVDDASPDIDIRSLVQKVGQGRVDFHSNPTNLGLYPNCNVALSLARGKWIHILHDDDIVYPGFYKALEAADTAPDFQGKKIGAAYCRPDNIDLTNTSLGPYSEEHPTPGPLENFHWRSLNGNPILFPSIVVKKEVYDALQGFTPSVGNAADWVMWARIAQSYAVWYEPKILAGYRRHTSSVSSDLSRTASDIAGITQALRFFDTMLPPTLQAKQFLAAVRERIAMLALETSRNALTSGDLFAGTNHIREALSCSSTTRVSREIEKGVMRNWDAYVRSSVLNIQKFAANPAAPIPSAIARTIRHNLANQIMDIDPAGFQNHWAELAPLAFALLHSPLRDLPIDSADIPRIEIALAELHNPTESPDARWPQRLMLAALFCYPPQIAFPLRRIPSWLLPSYLKIMLQPPPRWPSPATKSQYDDLLRNFQSQLTTLTSPANPADAPYLREAATLFQPAPVFMSSLVAPWVTFSL